MKIKKLLFLLLFSLNTTSIANTINCNAKGDCIITMGAHKEANVVLKNILKKESNYSCQFRVEGFRDGLRVNQAQIDEIGITNFEFMMGESECFHFDSKKMKVNNAQFNITIPCDNNNFSCAGMMYCAPGRFYC